MSACPWPRRSPRNSNLPAARAIRPRVDRRWVLLLAGAVPGLESGSQPYRRLSGDCLRVLTCLRWVKLGLPQRTKLTHPRKPKFSAPSLRHHGSSSDKQAQNTLEKPIGMQQNCWQPNGKLLTSGNAVSEWNGARRQSEDGGSSSCLGDRPGSPSARRSRAVAGRLRLVYDHPVHTCG